MLMEAVKESLKHCKLQNPQVEVVEQQPAESSDKDESHASSHEISKPMETESSLVKHSMHSTAQTTSAASRVCDPLETESNAASPATSLDTSSSNTVNGSSHSNSSASS
ncbi:hypothetical protein A2U01_0057334, partial [Trifolium medium]|nr:hypothetical protein [Trifolium medium]